MINAGRRKHDAFSQMREWCAVSGVSDGDDKFGSAVANRNYAGAGFDRNFSELSAACVAGVRAASMSWGRLHLDAWILGVGSGLRRLLLGAGNLGAGATNRIFMDAAVVGMEWGGFRVS